MGEDSSDDIDLMERARILSDATGRDVADVLADLADDGILNDSNKSGGKDLIAELQDAARLIGAVQEINKAASENSVLNGGENKTEVTVETTLEGDIVDRAISNLTMKAENLKKLALIVAPVLLLITGGTMNGLGVFDGSEDAPDDPYEYHDDGYGGCTSWDAENYDEYASWDDGTCWWDDSGQNPPCDSEWGWQDSYNQFDDPSIRATGIFRDFNQCQRSTDNDGSFKVTLNRDGEYYGEYSWSNKFNQRWEADWLFQDLPEGEYDVEWDAWLDGSHWHWNVDSHIVIESESCTPDLKDDGARAEYIEDSSNAIRVIIEVNNNNPDCPTEVEVMVSVYLNNSYQFTLEESENGRHWVYENATIVVESSRLSNLGDGDWSFETRFIPIGEAEYCCTMTNAVTFSEPEPEPEPNADNCSISIENHYRGHVHDDAEQDAIMVAFKVVPTECDGFVIEVSIDLFQAGSPPDHTVNYFLNGSIEHEVNHVFDSISVGTWTPKVRAVVEGDEKWEMNFWSIEVEEQSCEGVASFYNTSTQLTYENSTTNLTVWWDADWSCDETITIEVDIRLLFKDNNSEFYSRTLTYNTTGAALDVGQWQITNLTGGEQYELSLTIWVNVDGWRMDAEYSEVISVS